jgi:opacity protein-like surface antigen
MIAASEPRRWRRRERPAPYRRQVRRNSQEWLTVRGGFFDSDDVSENDWLVGLKFSADVANNLSLGVSTDLQRRSDAERSRVEEFRDPAGNLVRTTVTTFETSSNLIPILGVVEMRFPSMGIQPYLGVGAGYEVLVVDGTDFATNSDFSDTFGGFGWQGHAGVSFALGGNTRLIGEGFWNHSTVTRKIRDESTGERVKEEIEVNGAGLRAGLSFGL